MEYGNKQRNSQIHMTAAALQDESKQERKKDILTSFKRPKWPIRPNKRLHLKCFLVFENTSK